MKLRFLLIAVLVVVLVFLWVSEPSDQQPASQQNGNSVEQIEDVRANSGCIQISVNTPGPANAVLYSTPAIRAGHVYENCCYEAERGLYNIGESGNVSGRTMICTPPPAQGGHAAWVPIE